MRRDCYVQRCKEVQQANSFGRTCHDGAAASDERVRFDQTGRQDTAAPATSAGASDAASGQPGPPGDGPPNYIDNNRWKQPAALSDADRRVAEDAAHRIRPALVKLRTVGDFAPASTQRVLLELGFPAATIIVKPMRVPSGRPLRPRRMALYMPCA